MQNTFLKINQTANWNGFSSNNTISIPNTEKFEIYISEFCKDYNLKNDGKMPIISPLNNEDFQIELAIKNIDCISIAQEIIFIYCAN